MHLDVMVEDLAVARAQVLALGAVALEPGPEPTVFADPAGHPFCLISRPGWTDPVGS